jgi:2-phospho-L-lactate guanylyltransferase
MLGLEVVALTPDTTIARISVKNGWSVFSDEGSGLNTALKKFLDTCSEKQVLIILPDLPLLSRISLETVLSLARGGTPVICPDLRLDGTNILYLTRIRGFTPAYGRRSFPKHLHQLNDAKIYVSTETGLDLDRPGDLALLASSSSAPPSRNKQRGHN